MPGAEAIAGSGRRCPLRGARTREVSALAVPGRSEWQRRCRHRVARERAGAASEPSSLPVQMIRFNRASRHAAFV